jgi:hypothetical protein
MFTRKAPVTVDDDAFFTHSIDVCAVVIMGDALYRDIRLSGNQVRARRPGDGVRARTARLRGRD